jgi:peptidoglycan/LPS O-acetylase OafA/YrhL
MLGRLLQRSGPEAGNPAEKRRMPHAAIDRRDGARFEGLDALRGVCALLVVFYHYQNGNVISELAFVRGGYMFVDFFFVLSGFVICWNYADRLTSWAATGDFMVRRFFRLFPLHLLVVMLYLALELALMSRQPAGTAMGAVSGRTADDLVRTLLMSNSFGMDHQTGWNMPSWSISAEWWTYGVFGLIVLAFPARGQMRLALAGLAGLGLGVLLVNHGSLRVMADHGLFRCFYGFGLGAMLALWWPTLGPRVQQLGAWPLAVAEILLPLVIVWFVGSFRLSPVSFLAPLLFVLAIIVFAQGRGPVSRLLHTPLLLRAGLLSYSIYMIHHFIMGRLRNLTDALERRLGFDIEAVPFHAEIMMAVVLLLVWFAAGLTWRFVERPGQRLGARLAGTIRRPAAAEQVKAG